MKILKYLLFLILIVLIGGGVYFGTQDGNYDLSETATIEAPVPVVFNTVNDLKTWEDWGPWMKEDSTMVLSYAEKTVGEGASYSWTGEMDGAMKTSSVTENKEILQDLTLITPGGERNPKVYWKFEEENGNTKLTWGMKGEHTFMDKVYYALSGMDFDGDMKRMHQEGLDGIAKNVTESMKQYTIETPEITRYGGGYYMYVTTSAKQNELSMRMGQMYGQIGAFMAQNNLQQSGMPFTIYHQVDDANNTFIFSSAIPVKERVITPAGSTVQCGFIPATPALKTVLKGNYENLHLAYEAAQKFMADKNIQADTSKDMFEIYANDPGEFPNPADWTTEIFMPIIVPAGESI